MYLVIFVLPMRNAFYFYQVEEIENLDDYVTDLSVDASATTGVPFIPFSGSSRFSNFVEDSIRRERKAFKMSTYCYRWDVGISSVKTLEWYAPSTIAVLEPMNQNHVYPRYCYRMMAE